MQFQLYKYWALKGLVCTLLLRGHLKAISALNWFLLSYRDFQPDANSIFVSDELVHFNLIN